jgi:hypothetical protein
MTVLRRLGIAVLFVAGCAQRPSDAPAEKRSTEGASTKITVQPGVPGCGSNPMDWCPSPPGDPCGLHANEKACRADPHCKGMPYHGESVVACNDDGNGFWRNCPAVGCVSR